MLIRDALPSDEPRWRRLWDGYLAFYETTLPEDVTARTWNRLIHKSDGLFCRVAETAGEVCGFSHSVLHAGTWTTTSSCYLEDLFVAPEQRGRGVGEALIRDLAGLAKAKGWSRLYWHTRGSNAAARRVYDRFIAADDFVRYRIFFGPDAS
ncbi:GNAT family acetyltransferase [Hyphomicrobium nitrativorans NL23]|uniref:GNAT family acetyltransferase n=1 Tax=Hyphomicrobium nitrativorans NL23 TaxID=1029756 RepID=V5SAB5_9HYPH|nr:GNAT family N-acetyltransferase [Hyphomicrobium nitrativorans]AHB47160.1 GNAT family acetyltransferase [Hyphomicrobium nitrativorans NL23]